MGLRVRNDLYNCQTQIDTTQILQTSRLISQITGYQVQPTKLLLVPMLSHMSRGFIRMAF